jgi:hypothetical protein
MMKMKYFAPETEQIDVRIERAFLGLSSGNGTASADKMNSETWTGWDE